MPGSCRLKPAGVLMTPLRPLGKNTPVPVALPSVSTLMFCAGAALCRHSAAGLQHGKLPERPYPNAILLDPETGHEGLGCSWAAAWQAP